MSTRNCIKTFEDRTSEEQMLQSQSKNTSAQSAVLLVLKEYLNLKFYRFLIRIFFTRHLLFFFEKISFVFAMTM